MFHDKQPSHSNTGNFPPSPQGSFLIVNPQSPGWGSSGKRCGEWELQEVAKYVVYMKENGEKLTNLPSVKVWEFFKRMSRFIRSRNFRQCKLQHDKFIRALGNFAAITESLSELNPSLMQLIETQRQAYNLQGGKENEREIKLKRMGLKTSDEYQVEEQIFEDKLGELRIENGSGMDVRQKEKEREKDRQIGGDIFVEWMKRYRSIRVKDQEN